MTLKLPGNPTLALCDGVLLVAANQAVCAAEIPDGAPEEIQLMPLGDIQARDGRRWHLKNAAAVVAASSPKGIDLVIDYNHQTDLVNKTGHEAPAAGWIKKLMVRADGIWARVEWTPKAKEHLANREYRYISPTFLFEKKTGVVQRILRAALTNDPALHLKALASQDNEEDKMEELLKALAALLGLAEDADREKAITAVKDLVEQSTKNDETVKAVCKSLDIGPDATGDDIAKAVDTAKAQAEKAGGKATDESKYVAVEKYDELAKNFAAFEGERAAEKATATVAAAVEDGKVTPHLKEWALDYAKRDPAGFAGYIAGAPVITGQGRVISGNPKSGSGLDEDEKAVCAALGLDADDFKKTREQDEQENAA